MSATQPLTSRRPWSIQVAKKQGNTQNFEKYYKISFLVRKKLQYIPELYCKRILFIEAKAFCPKSQWRKATQWAILLNLDILFFKNGLSWPLEVKNLKKVIKEIWKETIFYVRWSIKIKKIDQNLSFYLKRNFC